MLFGVHFSVIFFLVTFANAEQKSLDKLPKLLANIIFLHQSASLPDGPDPPFALIAAFRVLSSNMLQACFDYV